MLNCDIIDRINWKKSGAGRMNYEEAFAYIEKVQKKGSILGLEPVKNLLKAFDNPQDKLNVIHVAGTNGKGSICTFLEAMYLAEGKKVGRYISPTLHCYLERFQINRKYMEESDFAKLLTRVKEAVEVMEEKGMDIPTAFEIETVIAFLYFVEQKTDIVILETGLGGREDATNVVTKPLCTVFGAIGMDHMQVLGDTIEKIAFEKAGIMKDGCPAVTYPNSTAVMKVLKEQGSLHNVELREINVGLHNADADDWASLHNVDFQIVSETLSETRFIYKGMEYEIQMLGEYQIYNAITAIETKLLLDGTVIPESLKRATWEGRFEKLSDKPLFIKDGAHNIDGVKALKESIEKHFTNYKLVFIIGVLGDKEYEKMMSLLCPMAATIFTVTPENSRGLHGGVLRETILPYCKETYVCKTVKDAKEQAEKKWFQYEEEGEKAAIVAWGSLSYIGQI